MKYVLEADYSVPIDIKMPDFATQDPRGQAVLASGRLTIHTGFMWDGCSGPCVDTRANHIPSLVHDALCRMLEAGECDIFDRRHAKRVHKLFRKHLKLQGVDPTIAQLMYQAVRVAWGGYGYCG